MIQDYSEKINQLRAVGAVWIYCFHYYHFILHGYFEPLNSFNPFLILVYHGYFIVYLFFAMSGFLFAQNYKDKLDIKLFFRKRIISIFPAYYLCLATYVVLFTDSQSLTGLLFSPFALNIKNYANTIGHLWFINRLLICYLCFPFFWFLHKKAGYKGLVGIWMALVFCGLYWSVNTQLSLDVLFGSLPLCMSHFLFAVILGFYYKKKGHSSLVIPVMGGMFILGITGIHQMIWKTPLTYSELGAFWYYFLTVWFAGFVYYYSRLTFKLPKILNTFMNQLGKQSYNIYLYHFLVIQFVIVYEVPLLSNGWANFLLLFAVTLVIAYFVKLLFTVSYTTYKMFVGFWGVKN